MEADIREILKRYWGYGQFRPLQEEIILSVMAGKDTLALMPTGGGKSITYQVPGIVLPGTCLVITPLIALMKDQIEELKKRDIPAEAIYTGMTPESIESNINKAVGGKIKFLYVSPERLVSRHFRERLKQMKVSMLAVDEAHCISQWGYDFRPSYLQIAEVRAFFPKIPVLALTATATPQVAADIQCQLKFSAPHILSKSFRRENLAYVVRKANDKLGELLHILSKFKASAIVYVRKRATAEELAGFLTAKGLQADYYHAGLTSLQRERRQEAWKQGCPPVIVATNAFGMGINKPDVRIVVHFDIPDSPEAYFQEAGRAGRDGAKAYAVLLYNKATLTTLKNRITQSFPDKSFIREVYNHLGDFFQLQEGEGKGFAFEFDADRFVRTFKSDYVRTLSAIRILQLAGYLECTTEVHARSRLSFLILRDQLYKTDLKYPPLLERLVEYLLRHYPGIFVQYAHIDEQEVAGHLGVEREHVYQALLVLDKRKIISYIPGNDRPYIVYHQPRIPASYLHIGKEAYGERKEAYARKVKEMAGYIESENTCRQLYLINYFGQKEKIPCGICDHCIEKKKHTRSDKKRIDEQVLNLISHSDLEVRDLILRIGENRETVTDRVRYLLECEKIRYKTSTILTLSV